eukprot:scaffold103122_cov48-Cyclotella_meneghiniana.AAC.6
MQLTFTLASTITTILLSSTSARKSSHETPDVNVRGEIAVRESHTNADVNVSSEAGWEGVWYLDDYYYADELETDAKTSFASSKSGLDMTTKESVSTSKSSHETPDVNVRGKTAARESNTNTDVSVSSEAGWEGVWYLDDYYYADELETDAKTSFAAKKSSNLRGSKTENIEVSVSGNDAYDNCKKECANTYGSGILAYGYLNCLGHCPSPYGDDYYDDDYYDDDYYGKSSFVAAK